MAKLGAALAVLAGAVLLVAPEPARGSSVVVSAASASDASIIGNVVATPDDGPRTLYHNPAGVTLMRGTEFTYSLYGTQIVGNYSNEANGYDEKSSEFGMVPTFWLGTDVWEPWYVGVGFTGTVGTSFNFNGDPGAGFPNRFLGESSVVQLGFVAGREVLPGVRVGMQVAPMFSRVRTRFGSPLGPVSYDLDGFGVGGGAGILWEATDKLSIGVGYKAPGRVWLSGDADVGATDDEVEFDFHVPQQIEFGFAYHLTEATIFAAQSRWTNYTEFEDATIDFDRTDALDAPFVAAAKSRFRTGAGIETILASNLAVRFGFSTEPWMMEAKSLSPLLYDHSDYYFGFGALVKLNDQWRLTGIVSYVHSDDRVVTADEQTAFPGRYELELPITAGFQVDYRFSVPPPASPSPARSATSTL